MLFHHILLVLSLLILSQIFILYCSSLSILALWVLPILTLRVRIFCIIIKCILIIRFVFFVFTRFLNFPLWNITQLFYDLLVIFVFLLINLAFYSLVHDMHWFRLLKLNRHQKMSFVNKIESSFATWIQPDVYIFKAVPTSLVWHIEINKSVVIFYESICPRLEKSFFSY